jgi:hypothetical protein
MAHKPPPSPPPINAKIGSLEWLKWFNDTFLKLTGDGRLFWSQLDFTDSDLADLETKSHQSLDDILPADDTSADTTANRHVSDAAMKAATDHRAATSAHGATGDIVGTDDYATALLGGTVLLAAAVTDATASTVSVTSADASDLPTAITLVNEIKGDVNTLVTDLNAVITQLNALLASKRTAKQLAT